MHCAIVANSRPCLLLKNCEGRRAELIAAEILAAFNEFSPAFEDNNIKVGISVALTVITGEHAGVAEVFGEADCARYLAKEQGKNRVLRFVADDSRLAVRRSESGWLHRISEALEERCGRGARALMTVRALGNPIQ